MTNHSSVQSLSQLIQQRQIADRQLIEEMTGRELQKLAETLRQQSAAALDTTRTATERMALQFNQQIEAVNWELEVLNATRDQQHQRLQLAQQQQFDALDTQMRTETKRLTWLLRLPTLALLTVCLVICLVSWVWWRQAAPYRIVTATDGQQWQVMNGTGWRMCGQQPCRPITN